jgi:hypothetical protein
MEDTASLRFRMSLTGGPSRLRLYAGIFFSRSDERMRVADVQKLHDLLLETLKRRRTNSALVRTKHNASFTKLALT